MKHIFRDLQELIAAEHLSEVVVKSTLFIGKESHFLY